LAQEGLSVTVLVEVVGAVAVAVDAVVPGVDGVGVDGGVVVVAVRALGDLGAVPSVAVDVCQVAAVAVLVDAVVGGLRALRRDLGVAVVAVEVVVDVAGQGLAGGRGAAAVAPFGVAVCFKPDCLLWDSWYSPPGHLKMWLT